MKRLGLIQLRLREKKKATSIRDIIGTIIESLTCYHYSVLLFKLLLCLKN